MTPSPSLAYAIGMEETILQFGTGRFLRCFIGLFAEQLNAGPVPAGRIVAVQSTGSARAIELNAHGGVFSAAIRGLQAGERGGSRGPSLLFVPRNCREGWVGRSA